MSDELLHRKEGPHRRNHDAPGISQSGSSKQAAAVRAVRAWRGKDARCRPLVLSGLLTSSWLKTILETHASRPKR